jgi:peptide/nickel transport system substrate-binding protein
VRAHSVHRRPGSVRRLGVALLAVTALAAACGGDDGGEEEAADTTVTTEVTETTVVTEVVTETTVEAEEEVAFDPEGELRIGLGLVSNTSATVLDPIALPSPATPIQYLLYDTLLRAQMNGSFEPGLASAAEVVDPSTISIELNEGILFSDGTPLDAEAVKFSIERNKNSGNTGAFAAEMQAIQDIVVESPTSLTITFSSPVAGVFFTLLSRGETLIVSPTAVQSGVDLNATPIGAGPFVLESFTPEGSMRLVKNPDYFQADDIRLAAVEYVHTNPQDPQAVVNALSSGAIDAADILSEDQVAALAGTDLETQVEASNSTLLWGQICKANPPLSDVRVRQALNFGIDRDAMNELLFQGRSEPQWGFWRQDHPFHNPEMTDFFAHDPEKARALLAEAGYPDGIRVTTFVSPGVSQRGAEILQQQWAEIGVELDIAVATNIVQEFFVDKQREMYFFPLGRSGLDKVTRNLVPGSIGNVCEWNDPELNAIVDQLRALPQSADNPETVELWHQLEELALTEAMNIFGVFGTVANAWNPERIGGAEFIPNFQGAPNLDVRDAYIVP